MAALTLLRVLLDAYQWWETRSMDHRWVVRLQLWTGGSDACIDMHNLKGLLVRIVPLCCVVRNSVVCWDRRLALCLHCAELYVLASFVMCRTSLV